MKTVYALVLLLALLGCAFAMEPLSVSELQNMWKQFKNFHEKVYGVEEEARRFLVFAKNVEKTRLWNQMHNGVNYGVTRFMDLTEQEFAQKYLGTRMTVSELKAKMPTTKILSKVPVPNDVPTSFDWRTRGAVTPVKNQGACGSCWAFSTTGNVEGQYFLKTGKLVPLSEQHLVDCDHECDPQDPKSCDGGCNGGLMLNALEYIKKNGIDSEADYPYKGYGGSCRASSATVVTYVNGTIQLPTDEEQIKAYLYQHGPLAVALNAGWLQFYIGGISDPLICNPKHLDHGVLIVGYGVEGSKSYWIVKNSWGSGWGEKGYFRMIMGKGKCGINTYVVSGLM